MESSLQLLPPRPRRCRDSSHQLLQFFCLFWILPLSEWWLQSGTCCPGSLCSGCVARYPGNAARKSCILKNYIMLLMESLLHFVVVAFR